MPLKFTKTCEVMEKLIIVLFLSIKVWYGLKATVYDQCFCRRSRKTGSDKGKQRLTIKLHRNNVENKISEQTLGVIVLEKTNF